MVQAPSSALLDPRRELDASAAVIGGGCVLIVDPLIEPAAHIVL